MLLIVNGKLCEKHPLELHNRSFRYGDGLFEQLKLFNGKIFNSSHHLSRLEFSLKHLQLHLPCNVKEVFDQVEFLAQKNMLCKGSTARISIYRNGEGRYTPNTKQATYCIEISDNHHSFSLRKVSHLGLYKQHYKSRDQLSQIKSSSALLYVMASMYKSDHKYDDVLLINDLNQIIEASSSNLFIVKNHQLITPPLSDGPLAGCMRALIADHYEIIEKSIYEQDVLDAHEVFISNCNGLGWVERFLGNGDYSNKKSIEITDFLNTLI